MSVALVKYKLNFNVPSWVPFELLSLFNNSGFSCRIELYGTRKTCVSVRHSGDFVQQRVTTLIISSFEVEFCINIAFTYKVIL